MAGGARHAQTLCHHWCHPSDRVDVTQRNESPKRMAPKPNPAGDECLLSGSATYSREIPSGAESDRPVLIGAVSRKRIDPFGSLGFATHVALSDPGKRDDASHTLVL